MLDEWGLTLLNHLPMEAKIEVDCHGDAIATLLLAQLAQLDQRPVRRNVIGIPSKE